MKKTLLTSVLLLTFAFGFAKNTKAVRHTKITTKNSSLVEKATIKPKMYCVQGRICGNEVGYCGRDYADVYYTMRELGKMLCR